MTKPRFVSEPLPDGLDPDLAAYLQRQFDRIHDWWPKDNEERLQALEEIQLRLKGEWPIVDYSYVGFMPAAQELEVSCSPTTATYQQAYDYSSDFNNPSLDNTYISPDGDYLFSCASGSAGDGPGVFKWTFGTPYDVSTLSASQSLAVSFTSFEPLSVTFSSDGEKMFWLDRDSNPTYPAIKEYGLSTAWDLSTASYTGLKQVDAGNANAIEYVFSRDGLNLYLVNNTADRKIYQYELSSAWDISTLSYKASKTLSLTEWQTGPGSWFLRGLAIDAKGTYLMIDSSQGAKMDILEFGTAYDVTTLDWYGRIDVSQTLNGEGAFFANDCTTLIIHDTLSDQFDEYELG